MATTLHFGAPPVIPSNAGMTSATGLLSLLDEEDQQLKVYALTRLYDIVDYFWTEIADSVPLIEGLSEDPSFPNRELAAAVASRVYFHLEDLHDSLRLALGAGHYFDVTSRSQYVETLIAKCIEEYTTLNQQAVKDGIPAAIDTRLLNIVERMYLRCYDDGVYEQAVGVALEAWNLEKVQEAISRSPDVLHMLDYTSKTVHQLVLSREFRGKVLKVLIEIYKTLVRYYYNHPFCESFSYSWPPPHYATSIYRNHLITST
jgi:26S proteasome regulatory subunit N2